MLYSLSDGKMKNISVPENHEKNQLEIGTVLHVNGYSNPKYAIIKNLGISPQFAFYGARYLCVNLLDYEEHQDDASSLQYLSEKQDERIQTYISEEKVTPQECLELWEKAQAKKVSDVAKQEAVKSARETEIKQLKEKYPELVQTGPLIGSRIAATKNIRIELKKAFPGIKFSVTSHSYSGGNSIHIRWADGPSVKQVEAITQKYQEGDFNGMEDIYENSYATWNNVFGGSKYVMEQRSYSHAVSEKTLKQYLIDTGQEYKGLDHQGYNHRTERVTAGHTIVWQELEDVDLSNEKSEQN